LRVKVGEHASVLWRVIRQQKAAMDVGQSSPTGEHRLKGTHHRHASRPDDTARSARRLGLVEFLLSAYRME
jgi:hypothetical protein